MPPADGAKPYSPNTTMEEVGRSCCLGRLVLKLFVFMAARETQQNGGGADAVRLTVAALLALPLRAMAMTIALRAHSGAIGTWLLAVSVHALNRRWCAFCGALCGCGRSSRVVASDGGTAHAV